MTRNTIQLGILVNSDVFVRGLKFIIQESVPHDIEWRVMTPETANDALGNGELDLFVLDSNQAREVADRITRERRPRIIVISDRQRLGAGSPIPAKRACAFFPARDPEWKLRYQLHTTVGCIARSHGDHSMSCKQCPIRESGQTAPSTLSPREIQVMEGLGRLQTNREIADDLGISVKTVETHLGNIKHKLNLKNSREVFKRAIRWVEGR